MLKSWPAILTLGWILMVVAASQATVALFSLATRDGEALLFAEDAALVAVVGAGCILATSGRPFELRFRDATLLTVLAWFVVPVSVALPFLGEPAHLTPVDAYFEAVSGLTTTGATTLANLDEMPRSILLWRSLSQWIGGVGIIGLAIVVLPFLKVGGMNLFRIEFSDRNEKALPRARSIVTGVLGVYAGLTVLCFVTYLMLGMTGFDALNHALTTVPTGGFSTHDSSFGYFQSPALRWACITFMILGSIPLISYFRIWHRSARQQPIDPQIRGFIIALLSMTAILTGWLLVTGSYDLFDALTEAAFNIVSIVTTTGFASTDYLAWGTFAVVFFLVLTLVGGCAGSTAGGLKIFRFQMIGQAVGRQIGRALRPHAVIPLRYGGRLVPEEQISSIAVFIFLFLTTIALVTLILAAIGLDPETAFSAAATAISNVGPGIGTVIGPTGTFAPLPDAAKVILSLAMVMGRLEIVSVLLLLSPSFYR